MILVVIMGQACNLKCINCGNFCPISLPETKRYPVEMIIRSLNLLLKNSGRIINLQIQGEPFLYTDLVKLLNWIKTQRKINGITIATNGTLLPKENELQAMANDL